MASWLNKQTNGVVPTLFKEIGNILMKALGVYLLLKAVWDKIGDEVSHIFSTLLGWVPELDLSSKASRGSGRRFMMNVNIRTDFKSAVRLRDRVETSLSLFA